MVVGLIGKDGLPRIVADVIGATSRRSGPASSRQMSSYSEHACDTAAALRAAGGRSWSGGKPVLEFDVAELIDRAHLLQDAALVSTSEEVHQ